LERDILRPKGVRTKGKNTGFRKTRGRGKRNPRTGLSDALGHRRRKRPGREKEKGRQKEKMENERGMEESPVKWGLDIHIN